MRAVGGKVKSRRKAEAGVGRLEARAPRSQRCAFGGGRGRLGTAGRRVEVGKAADLRAVYFTGSLPIARKAVVQ